MIIVSCLLNPICFIPFLNSQNQFVTYMEGIHCSLNVFFKILSILFFKKLHPSVSLWLLIFLSPFSISFWMHCTTSVIWKESLVSFFFWQRMYIEAIFWGFRPCIHTRFYTQPLSSPSIPRPPLAPFLYFLICFLFLLAPLCHCQISPVCSFLSSPTSSYFFHTPSSLSISLSIPWLCWLVPLWHAVSCL